MVSREEIAEIRRLFNEHHSERDIAHYIGCARKTVHTYVKGLTCACGKPLHGRCPVRSRLIKKRRRQVDLLEARKSLPEKPFPVHEHLGKLRKQLVDSFINEKHPDYTEAVLKLKAWCRVQGIPTVEENIQNRNRFNWKKFTF